MSKARIVFRHFIFGDTFIERPVDWTGERFHNRNWRHNFMKMKWLVRGFLTKSTQPLARTMLLDFLEFFFAPDNKKHRWAGMSDHGLASRLNSLTTLWQNLERLKFDEETSNRFYNCIQLHLKRIRHPNVYREDHNHGVMVNRSILATTRIIPSLDVDGSIAIKAMAAINRQITLLHDEYGFSLEHSVGYQLTNCVRFQDAIGEASAREDEFDNAAFRSCEMIAVSSAMLGQMMLRPNGNIAPIGDTKCRYDAKPVLALLNTSLVDDTHPAALIVPRAGFAAFRSAYADNPVAVHLSMMCGWHSHTHKHNDDLAVTLSYGAHDILDDPSFSEAIKDVPYLSESRHNTVTLEGREWRSAREPNGQTRMVAWGVVDGAMALIAQHGRIDGHKARRAIVVTNSGLLIINDQISSEVPPEMIIQWFQLGQGSEAKLVEDSAEIEFEGATRANMVFEGEAELLDGFLIRDHKCVDAQRIRVRAPNNATVWFKPAHLQIRSATFERISEEMVTVVIDSERLEIPMQPAKNAMFSVDGSRDLTRMLPLLSKSENE